MFAFPFLRRRAHCAVRSTRCPGSVSGTRSAAQCSPWSTAFPPRSPPTVARLCSSPSSVLCGRPTPHQRACRTSAHALLRPARRMIAGGHRWGLPVLVHGVSRRARGLGLRRVHGRLALALTAVLPSATWYNVGAPDAIFRSSIPGLPVPLSTLRWPPRGWPRKTRGQDGSLLLSCMTLSFPTPCRFIPAHTTGC